MDDILLKPIIKSSFNPGVIQTIVDAKIFYKCYTDGRGPRLPLGVTLSNSLFSQRGEETDIFLARCLATKQLQNPIQLMILVKVVRILTIMK